jgi:hypothetical protein
MEQELRTEAISQSVSDVSPGALEVIERAQIDMQISTAKRYPRTLSKVKEEMTAFATLDEATASGCFYTLPRGGKVIQGPSIRMAEIAIACYGNLRAGSRVISTVTDGDAPHVVVQSVAHDLEKNVMITIEKRGRIFQKKNKDGSKKPIDEDDVNLACNRCSAIALRDAAFKVIPLALVKPVYEKARKVAVGDAKSFAANRRAYIDRLKQMGVVEEERIYAVLEVRKLDDILPEHLETLIGLANAIKDGEATIEDLFPPVKRESKSESVAVDGSKSVKEEAKSKEKDEVPGLEPKTDAPTTPQQDFRANLERHNVPFDDVRSWLMHGVDNNGDSYADWNEIPTATIEKIIGMGAKGIPAIVKIYGTKGGAK